MPNQIEFTSTNVKPFSQWLKKFALIDPTLLLELDEVKQRFVAKSHNKEKSVVKCSEISFADAGFVTKKQKDAKRVKIGVFHISRLMKIMDQFAGGEFTFTVNYDELTGDTKDFAAISLKFSNEKLKMTVECTSLNIFKYIADELFKNNIARVDSVCTFSLSKDTIETIGSLSVLDNDDEYITFQNVDGKVYVKGKSFELNVADGGKEEIELIVSKEQFEKLDVEDYSVLIGEDKLVFNSTDSETTSVMSPVVKE
jgi:hypothetical protein